MTARFGWTRARRTPTRRSTSCRARRRGWRIGEGRYDERTRASAAGPTRSGATGATLARPFGDGGRGEGGVPPNSPPASKRGRHDVGLHRRRRRRRARRGGRHVMAARPQGDVRLDGRRPADRGGGQRKVGPPRGRATELATRPGRRARGGRRRAAHRRSRRRAAGRAAATRSGSEARRGLAGARGECIFETLAARSACLRTRTAVVLAAYVAGVSGGEGVTVLARAVHRKYRSPEDPSGAPTTSRRQNNCPRRFFYRNRGRQAARRWRHPPRASTRARHRWRDCRTGRAQRRQASRR